MMGRQYYTKLAREGMRQLLGCYYNEKLTLKPWIDFGELQYLMQLSTDTRQLLNFFFKVAPILRQGTWSTRLHSTEQLRLANTQLLNCCDMSGKGHSEHNCWFTHLPGGRRKRFAPCRIAPRELISNDETK